MGFESFLGRWALGVVNIAALENECEELLVVGCAARCDPVNTTDVFSIRICD